MTKRNSQNRSEHTSIADLLFEIALDAVMAYVAATTMGGGEGVNHDLSESIFDHVIEALDERDKQKGQQNKNNGNNNRQSVTTYVTSLNAPQQTSANNYYVKYDTWVGQTPDDSRADYPDKYRAFVSPKYNFYDENNQNIGISSPKSQTKIT